jgi:hypothetical protein
MLRTSFKVGKESFEGPENTNPETCEILYKKD